jgi:hypothetical protein
MRTSCASLQPALAGCEWPPPLGVVFVAVRHGWWGTPLLMTPNRQLSEIEECVRPVRGCPCTPRSCVRIAAFVDTRGQEMWESWFERATSIACNNAVALVVQLMVRKAATQRFQSPHLAVLHLRCCGYVGVRASVQAMRLAWVVYEAKHAKK